MDALTAVTSRQIITLTTDFGLRDAYVGVMKGVILGIAPDVSLVDITHEIAPQGILEAAFHIRSAVRYFPPGTIHLAVIDPGVGSDRRAIAIQADACTFVGPDNGIFGQALAELGLLKEPAGSLIHAHAVHLTETRHHLQPTSDTFHGRDIFAPIAAHLANGVPLHSLGVAIQHIEVGTIAGSTEVAGRIHGHVVHIDRFGNAISNIPYKSLPPSPILARVGAHAVPGLARSYREMRVAALIGSAGYLEIAVRDGSAAHELGLKVGDDIRVSRGESPE